MKNNMTQEEKAKAYDWALDAAKTMLDYTNDDNVRENIFFFFPDLAESDDERIRKELITYFKGSVGLGVALNGVSVKDIVAYLEKQKERGPLTKDEEYTLHRIIEYLVDEACPSEWINLLHDIYCLPYAKQKDQNSYELIKRSWYMEGYHDREFGKEPMWIVKTGEDGPKYEKNERYGQSIEVTKPVEDIAKEITKDKDSAIRFLKAAGIMNENGELAEIYRSEQKEQNPNYCHYGGDPNKERCKYCSAACIGRITDEQKPADYCSVRDEFDLDGNLKQKPVEWSEEDKDYYDTIVRKLEVIGDDSGLSNNQIKFLREHCPLNCSECSEEDEKMLEHIISDLREFRDCETDEELISDYEDEITWLKSLRPVKQEWSEDDEQYLLICKNALSKYQRSDQWDANIISNWLERRLKSSLCPVKQELSEDESAKIKHKMWMDFKTAHIKAIEEAECEGYHKGLKDGKAITGEWSEEDKRALNDAIITLSMYANWEIPNILPSQMLESAERLRLLCPQPKKDLSKIKSKIILALHHATNCADAQNAIIKTGVEVADVADWLFEQDDNSQPHWKPSEEQIRPLEYAVEFFKTNKKYRDETGSIKYLESLLADLQKLM